MWPRDWSSDVCSSDLDWGAGGNPQWEGFKSDVDFYRPDPATLEAEIPGQINVTAKDFRLPQVWRSNIAIDQRLPGDIIGMVDAIYGLYCNSPLAVNFALMSS